jgi:ribosomal protein S14
MTPAGHRPRDTNQTCDRCGPPARAAYRLTRKGELYLCRHCTIQLWAALSAEGWAISPAARHPLVPQAG